MAGLLSARSFIVLAITFSILISGVSIPNSTTMKTALAEQNDILAYLEYEVRIDVNVVNSTCLLRRCTTKHFQNKHNYTLYLEMGERVLDYNFSQFPEDFVSNLVSVEALDNLGTRIVPVLDESGLWIPSFRVDIPPLSNYSLSLAYETYQGFYQCGLVWETRFGLSPAPGRQDPLRVTFAFPKNFTMLEYSTGGFLEGGLDRTEVRWVTKLVNSTYFQVKFLPFQTSKTDLEMWKKPEVLRERSTALSISSVFPDKGDLVLTVDLLFEVSPVMVESWSPYSPYGFIEILKLDLKKCIILDVSDGNGSCKKDITLTEPTYSDIPDPSRISAVQELGYYRPDFELNGIVIYPRYHLKRDNYFFKVSYSVKFSQDYTDPLFPPYRRAFVFKSGYPSCGTLSSNISSNIVTMFVFPQNAEPLDICEPKGGQFGTENGNPTIYWVENSDNSSSREYTIFFDIVPLRNGFNAGFALTLVQITLLAVSILTIRKMTFSWRRRLSSRHPHEPIRSVPGSLVAIIGVMGALLIADLSVLNTYGLNLSQNGILTLFVVQLACFLTALLYNIYVWFVSER